MLLRRSYEKEIMDDFSIADERIDEALKELKIINELLGGNSVSNQGIKLLINETNHEKLTVLDIGAGNSDILLRLKNQNTSFEIFSVDINKRCCFNTKQSHPSVRIICSDVFNLPFNRIKFDIVHLSLFLHHFNEEQIKDILIKVIQYSEKGIIINDLRRSVFALAGIKILTSIFSHSRMVKHDGPLSVRRGFVKKELVKILDAMGIKNYLIKRKWAFRWLVVIKV
ncbi:MAG: methyltransferase domain-containing protein [Ignavibacteriales bacterium]|nr:MAG: methyltransferase domain-containing protein [Ignavibacteriales bacterium]